MTSQHLLGIKREVDPMILILDMRRLGHREGK